MVNIFVSSQAARFGVARLGVASFSVLAHASLITFAVVESGKPTAIYDPNLRVVPAERVTYIDTREMARRAALARGIAIARAAKNAARLIVPDMTKLTAAVNATISALPKIPQETFDPDLFAHPVDARDFGDVDTKKLLEHDPMYALAHPDRNGAYTENSVEKSAWPVRDNPRPRYPEMLQRQGIEQSFVVEFVVDSTGRVDAKTLAFPSNAHPMFLRAVKDALLRSRFFPAELAGSRVRQLVQQQFTFVLTRR